VAQAPRSGHFHHDRHERNVCPVAEMPVFAMAGKAGLLKKGKVSEATRMSKWVSYRRARKMRATMFYVSLATIVAYIAMMAGSLGNGK
jgi:hypothetical protein